MPIVPAELTEHGPLLDVLINVSTPHRNRLKREGVPLPPSVSARALLDTGSDCVLVDHSLILQLALRATGTGSIHTATTRDVPEDGETFDVSIWTPGATPLVLRATTEVFGWSLEAFEYKVLLGRTVLDYCCLIYDGPKKACTLSFGLQAP